MLTETDINFIKRMESAIDNQTTAGEASRAKLVEKLQNFPENLLYLYTQKSEKLRDYIESSSVLAKAWSLLYEDKEPSAYLTHFENEKIKASPLMMRCGSYVYRKFTEITERGSSDLSVAALIYLTEACSLNHSFALMKRLQLNSNKLQEFTEDNLLMIKQMQDDIQRLLMYGAVGYMMAAVVTLKLAKYYWDVESDALELYREAVKKGLTILDKSKPECVKELVKMAEYLNIAVLQIQNDEFSTTNAFIPLLCEEGKIENVISDEHIRKMLTQSGWENPDNLQVLLKQIMTNYSIPMIDRELRVAKMKADEQIIKMSVMIQKSKPVYNMLSLK